jgi:hypothetical protein
MLERKVAPMSTQTPPVTYIALQFIAEIHPGDGDAIIETIENILCPLGHTDAAGDQPSGHECRIRFQATTGYPEFEKVLNWMVPEYPDDASTLEN